jgi:prepilin peptidase CpaA
MPLPISIIGITVVFLGACALTDLRTRRIPNVLSVSGLVAGLVLNAFIGGLGALGGSLAAAGLMLAILFVPFALGGIGGGDVKMMTAVGALLGIEFSFAALALGMILGGIVMVIHLIRLGRLREKLTSVRTRVTGALLTRSLSPLRISAEDSETIALPYSVPLGVGTIAVLAVRVATGV